MSATTSPHRSASAAPEPPLAGPPEAGEPEIVVGTTALHQSTRPVAGDFVRVDGEDAYRIENVDRMPPFFVSVVSDADHWLFASSTGALSAGRGSPEHALFPYETVDRIHDAQDRTGSKTILLVSTPDASGETDGAGGPARQRLWEPFSDRYEGLYAIRRSLTKSLQGDTLRFEEVNEDLGLTFAVTWCTSERFGFVKRSALTCHGASGATVRILDGVQNLMPYGVSRELQATRSVLADAYKKNERVPGTTLGLFTLSAIPVDKAEPSEALKATTVWSVGLEPDALLLSTRQLDRFRAGRPLAPEAAVRAERGAYFVAATLELASGETRTWDTVADIEQDAADVVGLAVQLEDPAALRDALNRDVAAGTERLRCLVAGADGEQRTGEPMTAARHRMNVLFNIMRGGVFDEGYSLVRDDVRAYVTHLNAPLAEAHAEWFGALPERITVQALREAARKEGPQLERLCSTYLPLSFSRRHGDPSRPWNHFSIDLRNPDGSIKRGYEGNWRDIFQNWEALGRSYPEYLEGMIATFVNASTADGYNPYRITDEGVDWEVIEPDDPWSYIGYWGDHQLIYLLRLLVLSRAHHPGRLEGLLSRRLFSYANVPYRIKPYADLLRDPHDTVVFDAEAEATIEQRVEAVGADGKMIWDGDGEVLLVTLAEKLLVPLLAKLTNFIPEGGIWMNTQRPEWNDANNALVGYGVSMVTLFALRRYLGVLRDVLARGLWRERGALRRGRRPPRRRRGRLRAVRASGGPDAHGRGAQAGRRRARRGGRRLSPEAVRDGALRRHARRPLRRHPGAPRPRRGLRGPHDPGQPAGRRPLPRLQPDGGERGRHLDPPPLRDARRAGRRPRRRRPLARGLAGGSGGAPRQRDLPPRPAQLPPLPRPRAAGLPGEERRPARGRRRVGAADRARRLWRPDARGAGRARRRPLQRRLPQPARRPGGPRRSPRRAGTRRPSTGRATASSTCSRRSSTTAPTPAARGRSSATRGWAASTGTWSPSSPSRRRRPSCGPTPLAPRPACSAGWRRPTTTSAPGSASTRSPEAFGAFPTDAYSHTPGHAGAKQPGMTGQVKEDILCRWGELGVQIADGRIAFRPSLLREAEFLSDPATFGYVDVNGESQTLALDAGMLAFTYCQVPVVYRRAGCALRPRRTGRWRGRPGGRRRALARGERGGVRPHRRPSRGSRWTWCPRSEPRPLAGLPARQPRRHHGAPSPEASGASASTSRW